MKKITKQAQHKLDEIEESKKISLEQLFTQEGYLKLSLKKLDNEQNTTMAEIQGRRSRLNSDLAKVRRLVKYKRERLHK